MTLNKEIPIWVALIWVGVAYFSMILIAAYLLESEKNSKE